MRTIILAPLLFLLLALPAFAKEPIRVIDGTVSRVSDGDTIQVVDRLGTKVKVCLSTGTGRRGWSASRVNRMGRRRLPL